MKTPILLTLLTAALYAQQPAASKIPEDVTLEPNVAYAQADPQQVMDIVRPRDAAQKHPAVLLIHGGGFRAGSRKGFLAQAIRLAQHGYVAATMDYRLAPKAPFPAAVYDSKAAVRYLRAGAGRLGIDPERICVLGG
jgi:acetyl esterase/lipase